MLSIVEQQMFDFDIVCQSINCSIYSLSNLRNVTPIWIAAEMENWNKYANRLLMSIKCQFYFIHFRFDCLFIVCYIESHCLKWLQRVYFLINFSCGHNTSISFGHLITPNIFKPERRLHFGKISISINIQNGRKGKFEQKETLVLHLMAF